jgi:hypothetical protein
MLNKGQSPHLFRMAARFGKQIRKGSPLIPGSSARITHDLILEPEQQRIATEVVPEVYGELPEHIHNEQHLLTEPEPKESPRYHNTM